MIYERLAQLLYITLIEHKKKYWRLHIGSRIRRLPILIGVEVDWYTFTTMEWPSHKHIETGGLSIWVVRGSGGSGLT